MAIATPEISLIRNRHQLDVSTQGSPTSPHEFFTREINWRSAVIESSKTNEGEKFLARRGLAVVFREAVEAGINPLPITPEQARKLISSGPH